MAEGNWIVWNGGPRPTDGEVEVRVRNGMVFTASAGQFRWEHFPAGGGLDVVAYRKIPKEKAHLAAGSETDVEVLTNRIASLEAVCGIAYQVVGALLPEDLRSAKDVRVLDMLANMKPDYDLLPYEKCI